jgi:hypothetical protein
VYINAENAPATTRTVMTIFRPLLLISKDFPLL